MASHLHFRMWNDYYYLTGRKKKTATVESYAFAGNY